MAVLLWRVGFTPSSQSDHALEYLDIEALSIVDALQIAVLRIGPERKITGIVRLDELDAWTHPHDHG